MKQGTLKAGLALAAAVGGVVWLGTAAQACSTLIVWQADLAAPTATPATPTTAASAKGAADASALGKATVEFDFVHPGATFRVETKDPGDVQQITVHVAKTFSDSTGPTLFTLYDSADGPLTAVYSKRVGEADLQKQPSLKIVTLADAVHAVLDGRAYVTVTPKVPPLETKPEANTKVASAAVPALSGFITMHKEEVYSNQPGDAVHDPALHNSSQAAAIPTPTAP